MGENTMGIDSGLTLEVESAIDTLMFRGNVVESLREIAKQLSCKFYRSPWKCTHPEIGGKDACRDINPSYCQGYRLRD